MLVVYHQYDWSSISDFHLVKSGSGAVSDSSAKEPKPPSATLYNGPGNRKPNIASTSSKTEYPKASTSSTNLKGVSVTGNPKTSTVSSGSKEVFATSNAALDPTRVALLLETRALPHLPALLVHFISVLPTPWSFRFVGSPGANSLISSSSSLAAHVKTGKLLVTELPAKYNITNQETISSTLTDPTFYKDFLAPAEWLLMFQSDSIICAASERDIEEWVSANYSWIGAPWNMAVKGGNGGFSLRHIPPILRVLEKDVRQPGPPWEDRWICDRLQELDATKMPGPEIEVAFSVESQWYEKPFGYHLIGSGKNLVADIWDNPERRKHILQYCPEIKIILDMDLVRETERLGKELEQLKATKGNTEGGKKNEKGTD